MRKHLYLEAYCVEVDGPDGPWRRQQWQKYRLGRILAEGIELLPDKFGSVAPKRPRFRLEYLLAPEMRGWGRSPGTSTTCRCTGWMNRAGRG